MDGGCLVGLHPGFRSPRPAICSCLPPTPLAAGNKVSRQKLLRAFYCSPTPIYISFKTNPQLLPPCSYLVFNGSFLLLGFYALYYTALEPIAGTSWAIAVAVPLWGAAEAFRRIVPDAWLLAVGVHLLSWFVQVRRVHRVYSALS